MKSSTGNLQILTRPSAPYYSATPVSVLSPTTFPIVHCDVVTLASFSSQCYAPASLMGLAFSIPLALNGSSRIFMRLDLSFNF